MPNEHRNPSQEERDERVALPLDAEVALRALLKVSLDDETDGIAVGQTWRRRDDETDVLTIAGAVVNKLPDTWAVTIPGGGGYHEVPGSEIREQYVLTEDAPPDR